MAVHRGGQGKENKNSQTYSFDEPITMPLKTITKGNSSVWCLLRYIYKNSITKPNCNLFGQDTIATFLIQILFFLGLIFELNKKTRKKGPNI